MQVPEIIPPQLPPLESLEHHARQQLNMVRRPPGPPNTLMSLNLLSMLQNQLGFMERLVERHGDVAYFRLGRLQFYGIHNPALINDMLLTKYDAFIKDRFARDLKDLLGEGLLTSEGPMWRRHRKIAAPALKRSQIASYAQTMSRVSRDAATTFTHRKPVDMWHEMMEVTLHIVVETLFGLDCTTRAGEVGEALEIAMRHYGKQQNSLWFFVPKQVPSPARAQFQEAVAKLDGIIRDMIKQRTTGEPGDDLLWRLIQARDDDGEAMTEEQLRDEALTMFLAGHETTALATTYAFDALARNPRVAHRMHEELDAIPHDEALSFEHLAQLPYTKAIIQETLRLYPPAWIVSREAIEDVQLGEWTIPKGSITLVSPWVMHRDARYFAQPLEFKPERWLVEGFEKSLPRHVYMPFGGGKRICIGNHFAMMEAILVVAELARTWRFDLIDDAPLTYEAVITMRPDKPVYMRPMKRT